MIWRRRWRAWSRAKALVPVIAVALGSCTTSFDLPRDVSVDGRAGDGGADSVTLDDGGAVTCTEECPCMWAGRVPSERADTPGAVPEEGAVYNDPEYGTCIRRVGGSGGQWLRQVTPDWLVSQAWSAFEHVERGTGVREERGVYTALPRYVDQGRFRYFRFHDEEFREADGLNAFCEHVRLGNEDTCVTFDMESAWAPTLTEMSVTGIRRRAVAVGGDGLARRWAVIVERAAGPVLATFDALDAPFRNLPLPDDLVGQLEDAEVLIDPTGEWIAIVSGSTVWRFRQTTELSYQGSMSLARVPDSMVLLTGPALAYGASGSLWWTDLESPERAISRAGAAPCGDGSVICDPVRMVLAPAPDARPGWVTVAFLAVEAGDRVPWAAGHLALLPLREDAPLYTVARHRSSVPVNGAGWRFTVGWDATANELMWRSAWDGTLSADTLFAAKLPDAWWSIDR